jgi:hypothetical protein
MSENNGVKNYKLFLDGYKISDKIFWRIIAKYNLIKIRSPHLLPIFYRLFCSRLRGRFNNTPLRVAGVRGQRHIDIVLNNNSYVTCITLLNYCGVLNIEIQTVQILDNYLSNDLTIKSTSPIPPLVEY